MNKLLELYNSNEEIKTYVDKYASNRDISVEEAMQHEIVKSYIENKLGQNMDEDWRTLLWQKQTKKQ